MSITPGSIKSPGVYINEVNAFPNSVVAVPTAIPAFIGYTPLASYEGKSYTNVPVRITCFADFKSFFCLPDPPPPADPAKQYTPHYYLAASKTQPAKGDFIEAGGQYYSIVPDPNTIYYLYNSVRLFFDNGGGTAYIVSVGTYGAASGTSANAGEQIVNHNVQLNDLLRGLEMLRNEPDPTMYICPEATLLNIADNGTLMQSMLAQSSGMQTSVSIFDIIGGNAPDPVLYPNDISSFRANTGTAGLSYGAAYYPFIGTTVMKNTDIDYTNFFGGDISRLADIINPAGNLNAAVASVISNIKAKKNTISQNNNALIIASRLYAQLVKHVLNASNILPPSGAIAGIITTADNSAGPWQAPANISIVGAASLPIYLSNSQQANLNVDAATGKSINVIRLFNGIGILVWGARTLDGNSLDVKYLPVRRTLIYIEQSCKLAMRAYAFEPNTAVTWQSVTAVISSFLTGVWKQGGLMGANPADAFSVTCGLGSTMTADDILNGFMNITIKVAVVHPAEFFVLAFQQQMAASN